MRTHKINIEAIVKMRGKTTLQHETHCINLSF
jgi:hypothetical protein